MLWIKSLKILQLSEYLLFSVCLNKIKPIGAEALALASWWKNEEKDYKVLN